MDRLKMQASPETGKDRHHQEGPVRVSAVLEELAAAPGDEELSLAARVAIRMGIWRSRGGRAAA